ncbi:MAG: hypothetical protein WCP85_12680 [Mariniphaga sp.]
MLNQIRLFVKPTLKPEGYLHRSDKSYEVAYGIDFSLSVARGLLDKHAMGIPVNH